MEKRKLQRRPPEPNKPKKTYWYIEPLSPETNEIIARRLAELNEIADSPCQELKDDKNKAHSVYHLISHQRVLEFYKSEKKFKLKFNVYTRTTTDGPIRISVIDTENFKEHKRAVKVLKKLGVGTDGKIISCQCGL